MFSSALALLASLLWGSSYFGAGILSRRTSLWAVVTFAQIGGLAAALVLVLAREQPLPAAGGVVISALTGVSGFVAIVSMYKALSIGVMSLVAPLSATGIVVPIVVGLARGDRPSALQAAGIALALVGIVFASLEPSERRAGPPGSGPRPDVDWGVSAGGEAVAEVPASLRATPATGDGAAAATARPLLQLRGALCARLSIALALVSALATGLSYVGLSEAARYDASWCVLIMRITSVPFVLLTLAAVRPVLNLRARLVPLMLVTGAGEVVGNTLFAVATTGALLAVVSVLGYLFPVVTIVLAHIFLHERLTMPQWVGAVAALAGTLLMVV